MTESNVVEMVKGVSGVQYTTFVGSEFRVVFEHNAPGHTVWKVCDIVGHDGRLGATQEDLPCIEFPAGETSDMVEA